MRRSRLRGLASRRAVFRLCIFDCGARHHAEWTSAGQHPDGCDDSGVLSCGAEHHAEWTSARQHLELLLGNATCGTHAGASRRLRRQWSLRLRSSAPRRVDFDRGSTTCCSSVSGHVALMLVPPDGCDDSGVPSSGARHHTEWTLTAATPYSAPRQRGSWHSCWCLSTAATTVESSTAELGTTQSGLRPRQHQMLVLGNRARGTHAGASR